MHFLSLKNTKIILLLYSILSNRLRIILTISTLKLKLNFNKITNKNKQTNKNKYMLKKSYKI